MSDLTPEQIRQLRRLRRRILRRKRWRKISPPFVTFLVGLGLLGVFEMAIGHERAAQVLWLVAFPGLAAHNWLIGRRVWAVLFAGQAVVAAMKVCRWA